MTYIVKQKVKGKDYYYLRKSVREGNKVFSKNVAYLGKDKKEAEKKAKEILTSLSNGEIKLKEEKSELIQKNISIEELTMFCKRKGFVYPSAEIYGGFSGFWDFGPLGTELKNNLKNEWWKFHVHERKDITGIDGSIITNPKVWIASGHVANFSDILVVCKKCKKPGKIDKHELGKIKCQNCGGDFDEKSTKEFKLMFKTDVGADSYGYLRPETAQLIFINFKFVQENSRLQLPFGIAQSGKTFRNEIAPRDFLFRCREFEQMEIEYFVDPNEKCPYEIGNSEILVYSTEMQTKEKSPEKMTFQEAYKKEIIKTDWHAYWLEQEFLWFTNLGANKNKFRIRQHMINEKAHYAKDCWDLEYEFSFGWKELQGIADRGDFDLKQHQEHSKVNLTISKSNGEKILPNVVCEPSLGVERAILVFMFDAYNYDEKRQNVILKFHPKLAPVKAAVFPLVKREDFEKISEELVKELRKKFNVVYDKSGSIGRRYARQDEIGTPYCITIDDDSIKSQTATIRDRDTTKQKRIKISKIKDCLQRLIDGEINFNKLK